MAADRRRGDREPASTRPRSASQWARRPRLREVGELLQVADRGQCLRPDRDPLRQRLAEVRAELDRLRALETDLVGLLGHQARPELPRYDGRRGRLVVRPGLSRLLRAIGREVTAMPLLDCPCTPDCPCDDRPPGCC